jgi:hypothetical protein
MVSMLPWCNSRYSAGQVTDALAEKATEEASVEGSAEQIEQAVPQLQGVVHLAACARPLAPAVRDPMMPLPPFAL